MMAASAPLRRAMGALLPCALLAFAGCSAPPPAAYPPIDFGGRAPIRIAAAALEVVDLYRPPLAAPHAEHVSPAIPSLVFKRWAERRLVPAGGSAALRVTIEDARIVETPLKVNESLTGMLVNEHASLFEGRGEVTVALVDAAGTALATARGIAVRDVTVAENATLREREDTLYALVGRMAADLDAVLEENIRRYFAGWLR